MSSRLLALPNLSLEEMCLNVVIIWIELQVRVSFMKWTIIVDFKRYKDLGIDLMDPVTAIQTGLYHSFYEHIIINIVEW